MKTSVFRQGDGWAVLLDHEIFQQWNTNPGAALEVRVYGESLIISPCEADDRPQKFASALKTTYRRYGGAIQQLVE